tara:strand:- start:5014 stop:6786 length:1773 start_codon:yes stop_codon:yes gene_type:complete
MKISKLLNKINFSIIFILILHCISNAEEKPVDIWNLEKEKLDEKISEIEKQIKENTKSYSNSDSSIYKMQSQKSNTDIELDENLNIKELEIFGLYDPEDNGLDINMWANSDGNQLKNILTKLNKMTLSKDASEIMKISLLTNAYLPKKNISQNDFFKFKSDWLIKNSDLDLIEEYLIKNQIINFHPELTKFLVDQYLSEAEVEKSCKIFLNNTKPITDEYLSKFNIFCLINSGKLEEAQLFYDLKQEMGLKDKYFEKKISFLLGYTEKNDDDISQKSILDFYLAHQTNPNFIFEPSENTSKIIWKYLSSSNLINSFKQIEISEIDRISTLEKATHNKNYPEKDLFEIYKRFQFNLNQLLNVEKSYKSLTNIEARALIYQKVLLESETVEKLKLLKILKKLFKNDNLEDAFDVELKKFLEKMDPSIIPDNLTSFYYTNINLKDDKEVKIKFNNDILHQSKLVNYFNGDYSKSKIEKDLESFLKKIKKNKKYFFSRKDQIFLESLKFDGIKISKKFDDLFEENEAEIPTDIQVMINNNEKGAALLRIVEVIGQDKLERIDEDTIYFIIRTLNHLNIDQIRNKILLQVLPLKV